MKTRVILVAATLVGFLTLALWQAGRAKHYLPTGTAAMAATVERVGEPLQPLPPPIPLDARKVALGRRLFHDPRLSGDGKVSCASCHNLGTGGVDQRFRSVGVHGAVGRINSPTVLNAFFNFRQFWDGRAATLEEQIDGPVHAPEEMGSDWPRIVARLQESPEDARAFAEIYANGIRAENVKDAIATFERSLSSPSRFDRYLRGGASALTREEGEGYRLFKAYGCASCHQGVNVGGNMYQKFGVMQDPFAGHPVRETDLGRFNVTKDPRDRHVFKVPGLRNVELTPPYFHDGRASQLGIAVGLMGQYQLGRALSMHEVERLVAFLKTLTAEPGAQAGAAAVGGGGRNL